MPNNKKKAYKNQSDKISTIRIMLLMPLIVISSILPLIVRMHIYKPNLMQYDCFPDQEYNYDFFLYFKQWIFVALSFIMVAILVYKAVCKKEKLSFTRTFIPFIAYAVLALLSTVLSEYGSYGFSGGFDQFENVFCLMGYGIVVYYAYIMIQNEKEMKLLIKALAIGAIIISCLGILQAIGLDYFSTSLGKFFIIPSGYDLSSYENGFGGKAYSTLFNPNYLGVYTAFIIPFFLVIALKTQEMKNRVFYFVTVAISVGGLLVSGSKMALINLAVTSFIVIVLNIKLLIKKWYIAVGAILTLLVAFFVVDGTNNYMFTNGIKNALNINKSVQPALSGFDSTSDGVWVTYNNNKLLVSFNQEHEIVLNDSDQNRIEYVIDSVYDEGIIIRPTDERFIELLIGNYDTDTAIDLIIYNGTDTWLFSTKVEEGSYLFYNRFNRFSKVEIASSAVFTGYETIATHRGYLWSRSIPLLGKHIILGSGADSFMLEFPQYDFVNFKNYEMEEQIVTKPHNLFLQIGVQSGVLSLLAYICFFMFFIIDSMRTLKNNTYETLSAKISLGAVISVLSFLISGLSNDSSITFTPVLFVIVGIGMVANRKSRQK